MKKQLLLLAVLLALLGACGFQLRGAAPLPFQTLFVDGGGTQLAPELQRALHYGGNVKIVHTPGEAQAVVTLFGENREKRILSLNASGRVIEYSLYYRISFRLHDGRGRELLPAQQLELRRDYSYSDAEILAKEQEEVLLYRDMQGDAVTQLVRRLGAAKM